MPLINTFSQHYKEKYGKPVGKIALNLNLPCPWGKCTFCEGESYKPFYAEKFSLEEQITAGKKYLTRKNFPLYLIYFQQGTTLAAPIDIFEKILPQLSQDSDNIGFIFSTRPDYLPDNFLTLLEKLHQKYPQKEFLIEIGLQSIHPQTLTRINRGHNFSDFINAYNKLKEFPFIQKGVHLIWGLPGEARTDYLKTLQSVIELNPDYLKFHHLQIIKGTPLEKEFSENPWHLFSADEYIELLTFLLPKISPNIILHRLWSTADPEYLLLPRWNLKSYELYAKLIKKLKEKNTYQGKDYE